MLRGVGGRRRRRRRGRLRVSFYGGRGEREGGDVLTGDRVEEVFEEEVDGEMGGRLRVGGMVGWGGWMRVDIGWMGWMGWRRLYTGLDVRFWMAFYLELRSWIDVYHMRNTFQEEYMIQIAIQVWPVVLMVLLDN